jgi:hypothetical protein
MLGKDVCRLTDWDDALREDSPSEPRLSHATAYGLKTRSNMSLFRYGVTDVSQEESDDNIIGQYVGDSVNSRIVRLFIDYEKFSNPFLKFGRQKGQTTELKMEVPPTDNTDTNDMRDNCRPSGPAYHSMGHIPHVRSKPSFVTYAQLVGDLPLEPPLESPVKELEKVEAVTPPDTRIVIAHGTYYMHEMYLAVNNDDNLDAKLSQSFKAHVIQNHQNLQEILQVLNKEKPLAVPEKPILPATLGKVS